MKRTDRNGRAHPDGLYPIGWQFACRLCGAKAMLHDDGGVCTACNRDRQPHGAFHCQGGEHFHGKRGNYEHGFTCNRAEGRQSWAAWRRRSLAERQALESLFRVASESLK